MASVPQPSIGAERQDLYRRMEKHNFAPLWEVYARPDSRRAENPLQAGDLEVGGRRAPT